MRGAYRLANRGERLRLVQHVAYHGALDMTGRRDVEQVTDGWRDVVLTNRALDAMALADAGA